FFFQAEDGIRYRNVTGVQTCALPILRPAVLAPLRVGGEAEPRDLPAGVARNVHEADQEGVPGIREGDHARIRRPVDRGVQLLLRSEERRVGKESRYWVTTENKKNS